MGAKTRNVQWISLLILALLLLVSERTGSIVIYGMFITVLFTSAILYPPLGLAGWLMTAQLSFLGSSIGNNRIYLVAPAIAYFLGCFIRNVLSRRQLSVVRDWAFTLFMVFLTLGIVLGLMGSGYTDYTHLAVLIFVWLLLAYSLSVNISNSVDARWLVGHAFIFAAIVALLLLPDSGVQGGFRFQVGGHVRRLANVLAPAILLLTATFVNPSQVFGSTLSGMPYRSSSLSRALLVTVFLIVLLGTVSRGVIGALLASSLVLIGLSIRSKRHVARVVLIVVAAVGVVFVGLSLLDSGFGTLDIVQERLVSTPTRGVDIRMAFWQEALGSMSGTEILVGAGLNRFTDLVKDTFGNDTYAHSVYVDTLVSTGLFGFSLLVALIGYLLVRAARARNPLGAGALTYALLGFATHGTMTSSHFWIVMGLAAGFSGLQAHTRKSRW